MTCLLSRYWLFVLCTSAKLITHTNWCKPQSYRMKSIDRFKSQLLQGNTQLTTTSTTIYTKCVYIISASILRYCRKTWDYFLDYYQPLQASILYLQYFMAQSRNRFCTYKWELNLSQLISSIFNLNNISYLFKVSATQALITSVVGMFKNAQSLFDWNSSPLVVDLMHCSSSAAQRKTQ